MRSVKVGRHKRKLNVASTSFTSRIDGKVRVKFKLRRKSLKALKRARRLRFKVTVTLGSRIFTTKVKLKAPA